MKRNMSNFLSEEYLTTFVNVREVKNYLVMEIFHLYFNNYYNYNPQLYL